ncbi:hypothetical protein PoB_004511600 [Plakobranchus ocellatus]|uniref:Uncharacterized protein n=1 Tax=Plakobranchus ocellatus TaxID=259542 RepID=A0AAV4B5E7_9GAST|nr:hypothetical protein PoB_004511600 [Plakobranchus ocellatus]
MAELSTLSICILCGGSALFIIILVAFIVWKVKYDRRPIQSRSGAAKPSASSTQTSLSAPPIPDSAYYYIDQDREDRPDSTVDVGDGTGGSASEDANTSFISSFKPSATVDAHERQQILPSSAVATEQTESTMRNDPTTQSQAESTTHQNERPDRKDNAATPSDMQEQHNYEDPATPTPVQSKYNTTHQNEASTDYSLASPITETQHVSTDPSDTNTQPRVYFELEKQVEYTSEDIEETDGKTGTYFELEKQESGEGKEASLKSDAVGNSNVYLEILP